MSAEQIRHRSTRFKKIASTFQERGFEMKLLRFPVARPELILIETLWSKVNRQVARRNMNFRLPTAD